MLIAVLIINLLLALLCWWAIWQLWRVRQRLAEVGQWLNWAERQAESLQDFPVTLIQQQQSLQQSRRQYRLLLLSLRQVQQGLGLLVWVQRWRAGAAEADAKAQASRQVRRSGDRP